MQSSEKNPPLLRPFMPELDWLRGIAVIMVVLFHGFFWTADQSALYKFHGLGKLAISAIQGGWLGVQLFFILSGLFLLGKSANFSKNYHKNRTSMFGHMYLH